MKPVRLVPLLAVLLASTLWAMPAAQADVGTHADPAGDVYWIPDDSNAPVPPTTAPGRALGDITRIRVNHAPTEVRILLTLRALSRSGSLHDYGYTIRTPKFTRQLAFAASPGHWNGSAVLFRDGSGNPRTCAGLKRTIDYAADTVLLVVPRACLGKPAFVRVFVDVSTTQYGRSYTDYAYNTGPLGNSLVFGPRVYR